MTHFLKTVLAASAALSCAAAVAGLGGPPLRHAVPSVASSHITVRQVPYSVVQTDAGAGMAYSEYVDQQGTVFAVTWRGPARPDLSQLLGSRFASFKAQDARAATHRQGPGRVDTDDLVVVSGGHMGDLRGSAWVPSLLPAGFDPADIQ